MKSCMQSLGRLLDLKINLVALVVSLFLMTVGCTSKSSSSTESAAAPTPVTVAGTLLKPDGTAGAGAKIFTAGTASSSAIGTADGSGNFSVTLDSTALSAMQNGFLNSAGAPFLNDFQLLFVYTDTTTSPSTTLAARTGFLPFISSAATQNVGSIGLLQTATLSGAVQFVDQNGGATPAAGVNIAIDNVVTTSDAAGNFTVANLAPGAARIIAQGDGSSFATTQVILAANATMTLSAPMMVYPANAVMGNLVPVINTAANLGTPDQINFQVISSANVSYIRYSDNNASLSTMAWQPISGQVSFNFPQSGANTLYYQFADAGQGNPSTVCSVTGDSNPFSDSKGIIVGDGTGVSTTRTVAVNVDVPAGAVAMRLSENQADLASSSVAPFVTASAITFYTFAVQTANDANGNSTVDTNQRTLYCQFKAADGSISSTYQAIVRLQPFPTSLTDQTAFTIGDGSGKVQHAWTVPLTVNVPANALEMRVWEEDKVTETIGGTDILKTGLRDQLQNTYFAVTNSLTFVFQSIGYKTIYMQFRDQDGLTSSVFRQTLTVTTLEPLGQAFTINGGVTVSNSRSVEIEMIPPSNAAAYRISEDPTNFANIVISYLPASKKVKFLTSGTGLRTIFLQYVDASANPGALYAETIMVDPFNSDPGAFTVSCPIADPAINYTTGSTIPGYAGTTTYTTIPGCAMPYSYWYTTDVPVTTNPAVSLQISLPTTATGMEVTHATQSFGVPVCGLNPITLTGAGTSFVPVAAQANIVLTNPGLNGVCVRFKNQEGDISGYLIQNIDYEPFYSLPGVIGGGLDAGTVIINADSHGRPTHTANTVDAILSIAIPRNAVQMRISSNKDSISSSTWMALANEVPFTLAMPGYLGDSIHFQAAVQFMALDGSLSPIYTDYADYLPNTFPAASLAVVGFVTVNSSVLPAVVTTITHTMTTKVNIQMQLNLPKQVAAVLIAGKAGVLTGSADDQFLSDVTVDTLPTTLPAPNVVPFTLASNAPSLSPQTVYLEYITNDGIVSQIFSAPIFLDWDSTHLNFQFVNTSTTPPTPITTTTSTAVNLLVNPAPGANRLVISNSPLTGTAADLTSLVTTVKTISSLPTNDIIAWTLATGIVPYTANVYMEYVTAAGYFSPIFSNSITVN